MWGWSQELVTVVIQCLRVGYLGVVSRAFSSIRLPYLAERLGLPASEAAAAVAKLGWTISPDHPDVLIVVPVPRPPHRPQTRRRRQRHHRDQHPHPAHRIRLLPGKLSLCDHSTALSFCSWSFYSR